MSSGRTNHRAPIALLVAWVVACVLAFARDARADDAPEAASAEAASPEAHPPTLDAILARGELLWGADAQGGAPYVFQDPMDPNHTIGFEVDLANAIARRLGVVARPVQGQWDKLLELLDRGDFDIALNGIELADEKRRVAELSRPYYVAEERLTVRRGDRGAPRDERGLAGRKVGTLPGSLAERILGRAGADVKTYDGGQNDIFDDLRLGRTDAALVDDPIARYYGAVDPELEMLDPSFGDVSYVVAVRKGDVAARERFDAVLDALSNDGTLAAIYADWGLQNPKTRALVGGDPDPEVAAAYERWRSAVGKQPPFWQRLTERYPRLLPVFARGAGLTLVVSILAMGMAIALGGLLAMARAFGPRPLRWLAVTYVEVFRGTPLLVQLTLVYFGLPEVGIKLDAFVAGVVTLGANYAAAEAENYRAGLASVPQSQLDAARTLGLSTWQALRHVVAPQALRVAIPPATNDFIALLKDSSLVSVITLTELTKTYVNLASSTRDHLGLGVVVAVFYLGLGLPFAWIARRVEARLGKHLGGVGA